MLWTKRARQCTIFRLLGALVKVYPILHAVFETTRSGFLQILHHCSVSWRITPLYFFSSNLIYFEQIGHWSEIFRLLSGWVKIHQIPYVIFETTSFFLKTLHHSSMSWRYVFCTFVAKTLYYFYKRSPPQYKVSDVWLLWWNFIKFVRW